MAVKKRRSPSNVVYFKDYKAANKRITNKIKKLTKIVRSNPNDKQASNALAKAQSNKTTKKEPSRNKRNEKVYSFSPVKDTRLSIKDQLQLLRNYGYL